MCLFNYNEIIGTSATSWEDAARAALATAQESGSVVRVAQVVEQDLDLAGDDMRFRTKLSISFKYPTD